MSKKLMIVLSLALFFVATGSLYLTNVLSGGQKNPRTPCLNQHVSYRSLGYDQDGALTVKIIVPCCVANAEEYGLYDDRGELIPTEKTKDGDTILLFAKFSSSTIPSCRAMTSQNAMIWRSQISHN